LKISSYGLEDWIFIHPPMNQILYLLDQRILKIQQPARTDSPEEEAQAFLILKS
jgi:hypothetical protein